MATFKICIFKHQRRNDGKYPVSIRLCHKRKYSYLKTGYNVSEKQINKRTFEVRDTIIVKDLNDRIFRMEKIISERLGFEVESYDAKALSLFLENELQFTDEMNFVTYGNIVADRREASTPDSGKNIRRTVNMVVDFCKGRKNIMFSELTYSFMAEFTEYMKHEHTTIRTGKSGKRRAVVRKGASDQTICDYIADIRNIVHRAMDEFNTETTTRISDWGVRKFKFVPSSTPKRRTITPEDLKKLIWSFGMEEIHGDWKDTEIFSGSAFLTSFYLCGTNFTDLYHCRPANNGRIEYKRQKTRTRRPDEAFISILIPDEMKWIMKRFGDNDGVHAFRWHRRYKTHHHVFVGEVDDHLKAIAKRLKIDVPLSSYYARHTWATIARNKAGVSKDDIDLALNHINMDKKVTDIYIDPDFSLIDAANRSVIDYINSLPFPVITHDDETPPDNSK